MKKIETARNIQTKYPAYGLCLTFVIFMILFLFLLPPIAMSQKAEETVGTENLTTFLPVLQNNFDATLGLPIFGLQMYGNTSDASQYHDALLGSNATWLRVELSWASAEPTQQSPPVYQWSAIDNNLSAALPEMGGLNIVGTVNRAPSWAATYDTGPVNPDKLGRFAQFMGALVERYDGDGINDAPGSPVVLYWEIYNEPDSNSNINDPAFLPPVGWGNHGEEYAQMLKTIYPAVKAANPVAQVVFGGIAYDGFESAGGKFVESFLTDVLKAGGGAYFDVMCFHSYPAFYRRWTTNEGPALYEKAAAIRSVLASYGMEKPLIVTEAGWHDNNAIGPIIPGSPQIQSRYVVQLLTQSMAADLDIMIWWMLYDVGGGYPYNTGLVTNADPPAEKLSFDVYNRVVEELSTAHYVKSFSTSQTGNSLMEVHQFNDNTYEQTIYVAWLNRVDTTATSPLRLPASVARVTDSITGSMSLIGDGNSDGVIDGHVTVTVGANPLFIEVDK